MQWTRSLVKQALDLSFAEFSALYPDCSHDAYTRKRYNAIHNRLPRGQQVDITPAMETVLTAPLHHDDPSFLYLCDLHIPHHSADMLTRALLIAEKFHVRTLIIGGDVFNFDQLSSHPHNVPLIDINDELACAGKVLRDLVQGFETVYILSGNHDVRLAKKIDKGLQLKFVVHAAIGQIQLPCALHVSDYAWMTIGNTWLVGHPARYSGMGGKVPSAIAQRQQRNVIAAHNHVMGVMQTEDGRFVGIDPGHMTLPNEHAYRQYAMPGQYSAWTAGFVLVHGDKPWIFNHLLTDWAFWGVHEAN